MDFQRINEVSNKVVNSSVGTVKSHPGITALVGLGISWFIVDSVLKQKALTEQLQEETEQHAETKLPQMEESAKETANESIGAIAGGSQKILESVSGFVDKNPLMVGFLGLSAGLIFGIFSSGMLMGNGFLDETRRAVRDKTRQILYETKEKAGHVIDAARLAAKEEAERQDLMPH